MSLYPKFFLGLQRAKTETLNLVVKRCGRDPEWLPLEYKLRILQLHHASVWPSLPNIFSSLYAFLTTVSSIVCWVVKILCAFFNSPEAEEEQYYEHFYEAEKYKLLPEVRFYFKILAGPQI